MKKNHFIVVAMCFICLSAGAQLKIESSGRVGINTVSPTLLHRLTGGSNTYFGNNASIGVAGAPLVQNKTNIGVEGAVSANSSFTGDRNYGVLGIVHNMNTTHGRNYGVSGMIGPLGNHYGGAGVYGANSTYYYSYPTNIQGEYAGYFSGPVYVTGSFTSPSIYTISDCRLTNNVTALSEREGGCATLDNLLSLNIVEYSQKSRLTEEAPTSVDLEKADEVRQSFEAMKKEEESMSSRRHFGVIAEELQQIYPDLVLEGQDGYLSVNYSELVPLLIRSVQALKQELDELKGERGKARMASLSEGNPSSVQPEAAHPANYPISVNGQVIGTKRAARK